MVWPLKVARPFAHASYEKLKEIAFGFSDFVLAYLNGRALHYSMDNFMSRDYRYPGTVGFFDKLFLPLKKGDIELWFVVAENFGGWEVKAKFDNMDGITLK
jgi:hypothetical protein